MSAVPNTGNGLAATREDVVSVLELLATRLQWSSARSLIFDTGLHASRGWNDTLASVRNEILNEATWTKAYQTLSKVALQHCYVGNKHVSLIDLCELDEEDCTKLLNWSKRSAISDLSDVFRSRPFSVLSAPTTKELLEPYKNSPPELIDAHVKDGKLYLQFFSTRSYYLREPLDISTMSSAQQRVFSEYEELIGVKTKSVPCFDTVVVDSERKLIEIRIDFQPGMTADKKTPAFEQVVSKLNEITTAFSGIAAVRVGLMNLHPAINPLYADNACGRVTALGFVATGKTSSSNNHGQIHRQKSRDFRLDEFHVGGKRHVDKIEPYAIGITWPGKPPKGDLYLELKGSARALYNRKMHFVTVAEIVGCLNEADFTFVADQVLSRLKRKKT